MRWPDAPGRASRALTLAAATLVLAAGASSIIAAEQAEESARTFLLVAHPGLNDPNFSESVVLVNYNAEGQTLGVIMNRPTTRSLASILPGERFSRFIEPIRLGGPVAPSTLLAVFRTDAPPGKANPLLPGVFLAINPEAIEEILRNPPAVLRLFVGYAGWLPGQLAAEIRRGDWYVLEADADILFRKDTATLWRELVERARAVRAQHGPLRDERLSLRQ
jgi:putative transcriptional regulator